MMNGFAQQVSMQWLTQAKVMPTRSLQLSFARAEAQFSQLTDFSLLLAIIENSPSIVPPELKDLVPLMSQVLGKRCSKSRIRYKNAIQGSGKYSSTIDSVRPILNKYLHEKDLGWHEYEEGIDYQPELVTTWLSARSSYSISTTDVHVIGLADYIRMIARLIRDASGKALMQQHHVPTTAEVLRENRGKSRLTQKDLSKALLKISRRAGEHAPVRGDHQELIIFLAKGRIHVRPLSFVDEVSWQLSHKRSSTASGCVQNLLTDASAVHDHAETLSKFEEMINSSRAAEDDFQRFFEKNPLFLLGTDYGRLISQPILMRDDEQDLIPDFILIPYGFAQPKILDLKLPSVSLARHSANRQGFLQGVMLARDQLLEYRDYFSSKSTAEAARQEFGCELYFPKIAVIIGRSSSFHSTYERRKIESRVPDIEVLTYDDILQKARRCAAISGLPSANGRERYGQL